MTSNAPVTFYVHAVFYPQSTPTTADFTQPENAQQQQQTNPAHTLPPNTLPLVLSMLNLFHSALAQQDPLAHFDFLSAPSTKLRPPASPEVVECLPKVNVPSDCTDSCSICQCALRDESDSTASIVRFPCGHLFHEACNSDWLKHSNQCANCRYELLTDDNEYNQRVVFKQNNETQQKMQKIQPENITAQNTPSTNQAIVAQTPPERSTHSSTPSQSSDLGPASFSTLTLQEKNLSLEDSVETVLNTTAATADLKQLHTTDMGTETVELEKPADIVNESQSECAITSSPKRGVKRVRCD